MTIKDLRKIEGLAKLIQVYSSRAQSLTDSKEGSKVNVILMETCKELCSLMMENEVAENSIPVPLPIDQESIAAEFMARVAAGDDVGICESCQG